MTAWVGDSRAVAGVQQEGGGLGLGLGLGLGSGLRLGFGQLLVHLLLPLALPLQPSHLVRIKARVRV